MAEELVPLKSGSPIPGECTPVDHLPTLALKNEDARIAYAVGETADLGAGEEPRQPIKKGMLFLASRRQSYMDAFEQLGLTVCEEVAQGSPNGVRSFCQTEDVLRLSLGPAGGFNIYLCGRDHIDLNASGPALNVYWKTIMEMAIQNGTRNPARTKVVCLIGDPHFGGSFMMFRMFALAAKPSGVTLHFYYIQHPVNGSNEVNQYFLGAKPATLQNTAVLILPSIFEQYGHDNLPLPYMVRYSQAVNRYSTNPPLIPRMIRDGMVFLAWSQVFDGRRTGESHACWNVEGTSVPGFFPPSPTGAQVFVPINRESSHLGPEGQNYQQTAAGLRTFPGTAGSVNDRDSSQSEFPISATDLGTLRSWGLDILVTQFGANIDIGGRLSEQFYRDLEEHLGVTI